MPVLSVEILSVSTLPYCQGLTDFGEVVKALKLDELLVFQITKGPPFQTFSEIKLTTGPQPTTASSAALESLTLCALTEHDPRISLHWFGPQEPEGGPDKSTLWLEGQHHGADFDREDI